eukprot:scaffold140448_cov31-Tisochrysis_lutea.AAC.3
MILRTRRMNWILWAARLALVPSDAQRTLPPALLYRSRSGGKASIANLMTLPDREAVEAYVREHRLAEELTNALNEAIREQSDDPYAVSNPHCLQKADTNGLSSDFGCKSAQCSFECSPFNLGWFARCWPNISAAYRLHFTQKMKRPRAMTIFLRMKPYITKPCRRG